MQQNSESCEIIFTTRNAAAFLTVWILNVLFKLSNEKWWFQNDASVCKMVW